MKSLYTLLFVLTPFVLKAQNDSMPTFSLDTFLSMVKEHHPVAMQADLQLEMGSSTLLKSRGGFDPKVQSEIAQKYFKGTEYYAINESKLKIPTWFGIELEGGYEMNQGTFLNPENSVPNNGLWFAGIVLPIGEGLFIDDRRASLRKAQSIVLQSEAERDLILNELLLSAGTAYWDWFEAYHNLQVYEDAYNLAIERFNAVKQSANLGDAPYVDTLEAGIQVQNRILFIEEGKLRYKNALAFLSTYLWQEGVIPLEIQEGVVPERMQNVNYDLELLFSRDSLLSSHPELRRGTAVIEQLKIEERWSKEQLKPTLNLKYQPITEAAGNNPLANYSINNYTWGLQFEFPILLRKERGSLNLIQLKKNEKELLLENKRVNLTFKVESALNEFQTTENQIRLYTRTTQDYNGLLEAERRLFNNGESSLFLVNSRELGFINAQIKLITLLAKNQKSVLKFNYALGNLN